MVDCFIDVFVVEIVVGCFVIFGVVFSLECLMQCFVKYGIWVFEVFEVMGLVVYVDGVDEIDGWGFMVKGGGVVLMCEKIVVDLVKIFVCIVDEFKFVQILGRFLLLVEIIFMVVVQLM